MHAKLVYYVFIGKSRDFIYIFLICLAPVYHVFCRFSAAYTYIRNLLLLFWNASGGYAASLFFNRFFTSFISAPHRFNKSCLIFSSFFHLIHIVCCVDMRIQKCLCFVEQRSLYSLQNFREFCCHFVDRNDNLFSCVTAYYNNLSVLDILRTDFNTCRNSEHFLLTELPSRALLRIIIAAR